MALQVLLAVLSGFFLGRGLDYIRDGGKKEVTAQATKEVAAQATEVTLEVPPEKGPTDLQQAILDVLSGSGEAMTLSKIATVMEKDHFVSLIRPMRSLLEMGRVIKENKAYRLV